MDAKAGGWIEKSREGRGLPHRSPELGRIGEHGQNVRQGPLQDILPSPCIVGMSSPTGQPTSNAGASQLQELGMILEALRDGAMHREAPFFRELVQIPAVHR
jgi:hypothetical protein